MHIQNTSEDINEGAAVLKSYTYIQIKKKKLHCISECQLSNDHGNTTVALYMYDGSDMKEATCTADATVITHTL